MIASGAQAGWRRGIAGVLLMLFGCSHVPTEPTQGTPMRGKQQGPLPGVPEEQLWVEANVSPPPYPKDSDLVEFYLRGYTRNRFFIDVSSLTVGPDRVVRFALVIRVPEGTQNATFSGLRCADRDWKDYAFGRSDRTWSIDQNAEWRQIQGVRLNNYKDTLYTDYMCIGGVSSVKPVGDAAKLVRLLKNPPPKDDRNPTMPPL
jgi:CNP1-like family